MSHPPHTLSLLGDPGSSSSHDHDGDEPRAATARRTSKACENCRVRRTKCAGGQPCKACIDLGLGSSCEVRSKARPNRALPKLVKGEKGKEKDKPPAGRRHAQFVEDIELSLEAWAASRGQPLNLALPSSSLLSAAMSIPLQPLPANEPAELAAIDSFSATTALYFDILSPQRILDLTRRYHSAPDSLGGDQRALVLACLCVGTFRQRVWPDNNSSLRFPRDGGTLLKEDVIYMRHALDALSSWGSASCTALCALHVLHLYCLTAGGAEQVRDILGRMAWQVTELGIHRHATARAHPPSEKVERLFYMTLYKDSWFASLCGEPPFLRWGTFDTNFGKPPQLVDFDRGIDAYPFLVQLTLFENELLSLAHAGKDFSTDFVLATEAKWGDWMALFRDEQVTVQRPILYAFANIRFHWLRLMLRAPLLSQPLLRLSSLAIIARSVAQILYSYAAFAYSSYFLPTWGETRRISTCGNLLCVCYWEREMERTEAETLAGIADALLAKLDADGSVSLGAVGNLKKLCALLELRPKVPSDSPLPIVMPGTEQNSFLFDYSLPASMDPWFEGALFDFTNIATADLPPDLS